MPSINNVFRVNNFVMERKNKKQSVTRGRSNEGLRSAAAPLNGKTVIVIGGSSGIGYETALRLVGRGYTVVNLSRSACPLPQVKNYTVDVTSSQALEKTISAAAGDNLYGLIYCAGYSIAAPLEYADEKDYRYLFEVNYFGFLRALRFVCPYMKKRGGKIIAVSSLGGVFPVAFDSFYSSSKAALDMLVKSAAIELEPYNIQVCSLRPGGTSTGFTFKRKIYTDEQCGDYAPKVKRASLALAGMEQGGLSAGEVAKELISVFEERRLPLSRQCGKLNKFYFALNRLIPQKTSLRFDKMAFKL